MPAQICVLQHADDTPPGLFGEWLALGGFDHRVVRLDRGEGLPELGDFRALVVLGSEHSVMATEPGWIGPEIALTRRAIAAEVPVLGICFGGQMMALALGAVVEPSPRPVVGWHQVAADRSSAAAGSWLHYNYETFSLPTGAESMAEQNGATAAFRIGSSVAVQFHPEATVDIVNAWARWDAERLGRLGIDAAPLIDARADRRDDARRRAFGLFDDWASGW